MTAYNLDQQQLAYRYEMLSAQIDEAKKQLLSLEKTSFQVRESIAVIENLQEEKALFGLGGGVYVDATQLNTSTVLTAIGAGAYAYKPRNEAVALLKERQSEIQKALELIQKALMQLLQQQRTIEEMISTS